MSADELKDWLSQDESSSSGWSKDDGSGETVGHERSGRRTLLRKLERTRELTLNRQWSQNHRDPREESEKRP